MGLSKLGRKQKLVLNVILLALIAVLVALGWLIRQDVTHPAVATVVQPFSATVTPNATNPRKILTVTSQAPVTPTNTPNQPSPTPPRPGVADEVLAARRIAALTEGVGQIRELPKQQEIPLNFLGDREMGAYLRRTLSDATRRDYVARQQALLAALDLSPDPGEAFPPTVQTRVNHLIAFYSPHEGQIFVGTKGLEEDSPDDSLVHQYAHALIDQHFSLSALVGGDLNADAARARDALIEGDAMVVMMMHRLGGEDQPDEVLDELAARLFDAELTDYEGYLTSRAMRDVFVFPYREGARFVAALLQAGWWPAVNKAYLDPPTSTEQILHPEKYLADPRDEPRMLFLPNLSEELGEGWRLAGQDVLGELLLRAHLDQYLPDTAEAEAAAAGWDGDLAAVWRDTQGREVLVMRTLWDSEGEAAEFAASYFTVIDRRLRGVSRILRPLLPWRARWWRSELGDAVLYRQETAVLTIWAPDTDTMERVLPVLVGR